MTRITLALALALALLPTLVTAQDEPEPYRVEDHYEKTEHHVPMRDGVELFTAVYRPKDATSEHPYPILINRTPYAVGPYGEDRFPGRLAPSRAMTEEGYIVVHQDVRGRYMSDGEYDNMRPHVPGDGAIDESSDTYDTIEWLLEHVEGHNGKVGIWGISYPGFYAAAALPEAHPALVAASPQAPISDFYFDDFHHRGAFTLDYLLITSVFTFQKDERTTDRWFPLDLPGTPDGYRFYLELGPLSNARRYYGDDAFFWQQIVHHPDYDRFWQDRNILPHLRDVHTAVMTVGGWFDAEDLYGPLHIYQEIEKTSPDADNTLVMGPWGHGDWSRGPGTQVVGNIGFGEDISKHYQEDVEARFFRHYLKGEGDATGLPEALVFDTGRKEWSEFDAWPPSDAGPYRLDFGDRGTLGHNSPAGPDDEFAFTEFISDPAHPVPDSEAIRLVMTPRAYMTDDQRFASRRPDVVSFRSEPLEEDLTLAGPLEATLFVSTTGTDADWVVKLIDVYPDDQPKIEGTPDHVVLGGYEQLVRGEIVRGRYRDSFEHPEPFTPGEITTVKLPLQDVYHTFKEGHSLLVHVQSSWFPLFDRNPQKYVPNIYKADAADFVPATHRVYHAPEYPSHLDVQVLPEAGPTGE